MISSERSMDAKISVSTDDKGKLLVSRYRLECFKCRQY